MKTEYKGIISSIVEAFSMQPVSRYIGERYKPGLVVAKIVEENIHIEGDPFAYYIGYDEKGNKLFEYRKGTVNVCYE